MCEYFDIEMDRHRHLLAGVSDGAVVFSHVVRDQRERGEALGREGVFFPRLRAGGKKNDPIREFLREYLSGAPIDPVTLPVRWVRGTEFFRHVWKALRTVERGRVVTYAELAALAGFPRAYRAVGGAMARNHLVLCVPCHRVVARDGIGGFSGDLAVKRHWLHLEGVSFPGEFQEGS